MIRLNNLEISKSQVRPVAQWLVEEIKRSMENFTDESYQAYCVLTKKLPDKTKWSEERVSTTRICDMIKLKISLKSVMFNL